MPKILLVDDDEILLRMYKQKFSNEGFEVDTAVNGEEGIGKMKSNRPDVVVIDFLMPKIDGYSMLKLAKSDQTIKDIPVVFLTNIYVDKQDILKNGAEYCLLKVDSRPEVVVNTVKQLFVNK